MILPFIFGGIVGISLGLTGGGGSIFAVPLLVFGLGFDLRRAVAMSLAVVGLTALFGALIQARQNRVLWKAGAILGLGGIVAAPFGAVLGGWLREDVALYLFAVLMLVVGLLMLRQRPENTEIPLSWISCREDAKVAPDFSWKCAAKLSGAGVVTGILAGAFGVGGGFLVVPALLIVLRLDIASALGTSLVAIFAVAASGLTANVSYLEAADLAVGTAFLLGAGLGMGGGVVLKGYLPPAILKKIFAGAVIATGAFMFGQTYLSF